MCPFLEPIILDLILASLIMPLPEQTVQDDSTWAHHENPCTKIVNAVDLHKPQKSSNHKIVKDTYADQGPTSAAASSDEAEVGSEAALNAQANLRGKHPDESERRRRVHVETVQNTDRHDLLTL